MARILGTLTELSRVPHLGGVCSHYYLRSLLMARSLQGDYEKLARYLRDDNRLQEPTRRDLQNALTRLYNATTPGSQSEEY